MPQRPRRASTIAVASLIALVAAGAPAIARPVDPVEAVNTFIGTRDEGNTFPGASAPFGMTQVSPIGTHYAGWRYDDARIRGFGHFFLSGAGCWEQGGLISTLPTTGTVGPGAGNDFDTTRPEEFDHENYAAGYTHEGEVGDAGYYRTRLTDYDGIDVEATADTRVGVERYTFGDAAPANVFINVGQANKDNPISGSGVEVVDDHTVRGWVRSKGFCGGREYTVWFTTRFDRPISSFGTWQPDGGQPGRRAVSGERGLRGAWLSFGDRQVTATTAISHVDQQGADTNLAAEGLDESGRPRGFDEIRERTQDRWRRELDRIRVQGGSADDTAVFTTSLYHVLLQPLTGNDADGRYRGSDERIHVAEDWTYYQFFSLWDTYRTQNQLLAMLVPDRARDIARSVLTIDEQGGWLPRWAYANYETNTMTGDPVTPFLVDLWRFGALAGNEQRAYEALLRNADGVPPAESPYEGRAGNESYLSQGFVQHDPDFPKKGQDVDPHHGGSATMEYALADCSLSIMAAALGRQQDAAAFAERGRSWRNVWDGTVHDPERGFTGFPRPRNLDGSWVAPYEPVSDDGFHEGTAWQYQWLTQQDVPGLLEAVGGPEQAEKRLDTFFAYDKLLTDPARTAREEWVIDPYDYYGQFRYNPNNEPDLHSPWMYALVGHPDKTSAVARAQQTLFTNAPDGVTGNDDLGTMSAWYVFSALGLYPAVPGTGQFVLNAPRFERAVVELPGRRPLTITAPGADGGRLQYDAGVRVSGQPRDQVWVGWEQLRDGGSVDHTLSDRPSGWGTGPDAAPASPCAG
ncbi:putative alpha-1,2-mannosidase [Saccharopolyspora erythraea NRRL 2338]|uniref:Sugar hydrolase n=2 Tax=Saccharopolyspora erythraea TaxID=1836 RepID=A4FBR3_SACEN|nr:GH92 family glycosyl hydrolase [Saccharopolyspora erythraea]EQD87526.1 alpha-1 2-mannosidase [Saccharopolyspora erythraea D]PFG95266.1 putative alpha-1,2-mannosidase [Saccharopolyspora erythraea NRRL 2338]QRK91916.1 GH92 family glycosyl hydrolase [Saccharopolyspora erythraea]CAM01488.1 putative sugar hydrolase precursor [Saccharopolyspora erythraea NRRL 2338]